MMDAGQIKLIALDMDGTLLNRIGKVSEGNRQAIMEARKRGIHVVLSTGRSILTCGKYADSLELNSYMVTVNGSEIWSDRRELVERNLLDSQLIEWMWELSKQHKTRFWAIGTEGYWHDEMPHDLHKMQWLKFGFDVEDDEVRALILRELEGKGAFELSNSTLKNIEVNRLGVNKAQGLNLVCKRLGIEMKNVMAVGDSLNDIAMIKEAGLGIAMGNAQEVVKEAADWVTDTNDLDGVAKAIKKWALL